MNDVNRDRERNLLVEPEEEELEALLDEADAAEGVELQEVKSVAEYTAPDEHTGSTVEASDISDVAVVAPDAEEDRGTAVVVATNDFESAREVEVVAIKPEDMDGQTVMTIDLPSVATIAPDADDVASVPEASVTSIPVEDQSIDKSEFRNLYLDVPSPSASTTQARATSATVSEKVVAGEVVTGIVPLYRIAPNRLIRLMFIPSDLQLQRQP